jgi:hypothetical protein
LPEDVGPPPKENLGDCFPSRELKLSPANGELYGLQPTCTETTYKDQNEFSR